MNKKILGRTDKVSFPKLGFTNIDVKMDTGAYTSSIHCEEIEERGKTLHCIFNKKEHTFNSYSVTEVKSSNGVSEIRYKIKTDVIFFGKTYKINLTLSTRDDMKFPVLIGRQFLRGKFLVDVDLEDQSYTYNLYNEHSYTLA